LKPPRLRVAYLGPAGTYAEEVTLRYAPDAELVPCPTFPAAATAVEHGLADECVLAIENSLEGSVPATLDLLIHETSLRIRHELVLPIEHLLAVYPGTQARDIRVIYSLPQALGQCRRFLDRMFPKVELVAALSTASAVADMMARADGQSAAIANRRAIELYGAEILSSDIQDSPYNETRFVVLGREDHPPTGHDKTSLAFILGEDRPGILVEALQVFSSRNINLSKLESRPSKDGLGRYIFLVDAEAHRTDPPLAAALEELRSKTTFLKVFGSYPLRVSSTAELRRPGS
jgi:prephenate dehydratase